MSDFGSPTFTTAYGGLTDREVGARIKLITERNPYMAARPDAVDALARMPYDNLTLMDIVGQQYGMMTADSLKGQLEGLRGAEQRGIVAQLTPAQQAALGNMGYEVPEQEEGSLLGDIINLAGEVVKPITSGIGQFVVPIAQKTHVLDALTWVGNWPGHIYRSIRMMDDPQQVLGLLGAVAGGAAALALTPFTGGASLAALGVLGGGMMAGGVVGAALTAPGDWADAFSRSWEGERTFDRPSMNKVEEMLRDPRMVGLARDLARDADFDLHEYIVEMAAASAIDRPSQHKVIERLAGKMADPGSPEFQQAATAMVNALEDPTFQRAVMTLQNGKMSPGRDLADVVGLDSGSRFYDLLSGTTDAVFQMALDPTLVGGKAIEAYKATRYGLRLATNGTVLSESFMAVAMDPNVMRGHQRLIDIVNKAGRGAANELRSVMPEMGPLFEELLQHKNRLVELKELAPDAPMELKHLHDYFQGQAGIEAMMKGYGTVVNKAGQIQLRAYGRIRLDGIRRLRMEARSLTSGVSDERTLRRLEAIAKKQGLSVDELATMPPSARDTITNLGVVDKAYLATYGEGNIGTAAYEAGRRMGSGEGLMRPVGYVVGKVGDVLTSMTTMSLSGKAVALNGPDAVKHVRAATELMRYTGMPSFARQAWADVVLSADSTAARMEAMHGMVASMARLVGMDATPEGQRILSEFLDASKKLYGVGDEIMVNGRWMHAGLLASQQADMIVMPDLRQLRNAVNGAATAKFMGIVDHPVLEAAVNKVWKPLLLLRIGFIPRAAGEEAANFLLRGGIGSLTQEAGARYLGRRRAYFSALERQQRIASGARISLSADEKLLLQGGWYATLPKHAQPVARMMERMGLATETSEHLFRQYSFWLDRQLNDGMLWFNGSTRGLAKDGSALERTAGELAGTGWTDVNWRARRGVNNAKRWTDSIVFGGEHSIRRMILGGVDDDLVTAGRKWAEQNAATIMRAASATNAGPLSPMYDSSQLVHEMQVGSDGVRRPVAMLRTKGERRYVMSGDPMFATGLHEELSALLHDPLTRNTMLEHVSRVRGRAQVTEADLEPMLNTIQGIWDLERRDASTLVVSHLLGEQDLDSWRAIVDRLGEFDSNMAQVLSRLPMRRPPEIDEIIDSLNQTLTAVPDWKAGQAMRTSLTSMKPHLDRIAQMDEHTQRFVEQFLDAQLLGGYDSWWGRSMVQRNLNVVDRPDRWLYNTLDEAYESGRDTLKASITSVAGHDAGVSAALRGASAFKDQTVALFQAPPLHGHYTFEDLVRASRRPDILTRKQATVEQLLAWDSDAAVLVDDLELATELHRTVASVRGLDPELAKRPMMLRQPKEIKDGRMHSYAQPIKANNDTVAWAVPRGVADKKLIPTPDEIVDAADVWAQELWASITKQISGSKKLTRSPKVRAGERLPDGTTTEIPLVYRYDRTSPLDDQGVPLALSDEEMASGLLRPVGRDEQLLADDRVLYDHKGRPIDPGDSNLFDFGEEAYDDAVEAQVMWEAIGPMMRDVASDQHGYTLLARSPHGGVGPNGPVQSIDRLPLRRTRVRHIENIPGQDARQVAIGSVYKVRRVGKFEEMVQFGFDKVIGPSIDAIIRRPMAFHAFAQRYKQARGAMEWMVDGNLAGRLKNVASEYHATFGSSADEIADEIRAMETFHGTREAARWTNDQAFAHLRGMTKTEQQDFILNTINATAGKTDPVSLAAAAASRRWATLHPSQINETVHVTDSPRQMIAMLEQLLGPENMRTASKIESTIMSRQLSNHPLIAAIDGSGSATWDDIAAMRTNFEHIENMASETATIAAIDDVVPFLDSHEFKTQFADYGRGLMPFWYAEENFMKRWARALAQEGPQMIRKAQLTYMGLKHAGVVRTDESGRDWFVYPGSGLLATALSKAVPGLSEIGKTGLMFQTPTDAMLPGLNNRFGTPSFNPLVTIPMDLTAGMFGELQPLNRALLGDYAANEQNDITTAIFPAHLRNLFASMTGGDENQRYASAQMAAIAFLEARDQGLREGATPAEIEEYLDRVRSHARINVVAQAMMGFLAPGPSSSINAAGTDTMGVGATDWGSILSDDYLRLIRLMGVEAGTDKFLTDNPDATLHDIVNPAAYTVPRNVSVSGAPIPSTEDALFYYEQHANYMGELPNAAPYLLPQMKSGARSQYAFDAEVAYGLRRRRSPEEFVRAIQFKKAAPTYFAMREGFLQQISAAEIAGNPAEAKALRTEMEYQLQIFRAANPVFKEELESSDGRQRRARAIEEMRILVADPYAPESENLQPLRLAMSAYDGYKARLAEYAGQRSNKALAEIDNLKGQFESYMTNLVATYPGVASFWLGVLQPESSLN